MNRSSAKRVQTIEVLGALWATACSIDSRDALKMYSRLTLSCRWSHIRLRLKRWF